jgi:hypothetical protein
LKFLIIIKHFSYSFENCYQFLCNFNIVGIYNQVLYSLQLPQTCKFPFVNKTRQNFNARFLFQDVHETAAGALWNLAFNLGNALRIVEEGGVPALVDLCSSSVSKMARFMAALALAYMFDGRYLHSVHFGCMNNV